MTSNVYLQFMKRALPTLAGLSLFVFGAARAEGEIATLKVAMPILLKVLTYDQNFESRGYGEFVILVASETAQQGAREEIFGILKNLSVNRIKNRPLKFVTSEFKDVATLDAEVQRVKAGAILVVPGVSTSGISVISDVGQDNQIYTLALDAPAVQKAIAVGVTQNNGRPQILINEKASRALGVKFETSVLKLAKKVP